MFASRLSDRGKNKAESVRGPKEGRLAVHGRTYSAQESKGYPVRVWKFMFGKSGKENAGDGRR